MIHLFLVILKFLESNELISIYANYSQFRIYNKKNQEALSLQKDWVPAELGIVSIEETFKLKINGILTPPKILVQQWCVNVHVHMHAQ